VISYLSVFVPEFQLVSPLLVAHLIILHQMCPAD
jgi:hypothetical protein